MVFYILNESKFIDRAGQDVTYHASISSLLTAVEAIDVRNQEYFCYDSDGNRVHLEAAHDYAAVTVEVENTKSASEALISVLRENLKSLHRHGMISTDLKTIAMSNSIEELVEMVPRTLIV